MQLENILYVICVIAGTSGGVRSTPFDALYQSCPYTDFCQSNASKVFKDETGDKMPCCPPCSCYDDCERTKNCCPDKPVNLQDVRGSFSEPSSSLSNPSLTCRETATKRSQWATMSQYNGFASGILRYLIVDRCPDTEPNDTVAFKCAGAQYNSIVDYIWVTDRTTGKIYLNRHCAQCHAIKNFVEWNLKAVCSIGITNGLNMRQELLSRDYCDLINEPPIAEDILPTSERYRCYQPNLNHCNTSGNLANYDEGFAMACETVNYPFIQHHAIVYKNVFCYFCNGYDVDEVTDVCPRMQDEVRMNAKFNALISWQVEEKLTQISKMSCDLNEIFDKFTGMCRKLLCPFGKEAIYGKCEEYFSLIDGMALSINYNITIIWNLSSISASNINDFDNYEFGQKLNSKFKNVIGLNRKKCYLCKTVLSTNDLEILESTTLQYSLVSSTTPGCSLETLYKTAISAQNRNIKVDMGGSAFLTAKLTLDKRSRNEIGAARKTVFIYERRDICLAVHVIRDKYCPAIQVKYSEIKTLGNTSRMAENLDYEASTDDDLVTVCLDDYDFDMSRLHGHATDSAQYLKLDVLVVTFLPILLIEWS